MARQYASNGEYAIYDKLKKGPVFRSAIDYPIPRNSLVEKIRCYTTPTKESQLYSLIIGEYGTGKTNLIELAVNGMDKNEPKGVVYFDIPIWCDSEANVANAMREAFGPSPGQLIDSSKCN